MFSLKRLQKFIQQPWVIVALVVIVLVALGAYSQNKGIMADYMGGMTEEQRAALAKQTQAAVQNASMVHPSNPIGTNEQPAAVTGMGGSQGMGLPPSCSKQPMQDPATLLPKDENSEWAKLNPAGAGNLNGVNLLKAGYHVGVDTVSNTLRNANLQVRSEPANPQLNVGPWNNTTIAPDLMRVPLEVGQGPQ